MKKWWACIEEEGCSYARNVSLDVNKKWERNDHFFFNCLGYSEMISFYIDETTLLSFWS